MTKISIEYRGFNILFDETFDRWYIDYKDKDKDTSDESPRRESMREIKNIIDNILDVKNITIPENRPVIVYDFDDSDSDLNTFIDGIYLGTYKHKNFIKNNSNQEIVVVNRATMFFYKPEDKENLLKEIKTHIQRTQDYNVKNTELGQIYDKIYEDYNNLQKKHNDI